MSKRKNKEKIKQVRQKELKEFRFSVVIDKYDMDTRIRRALEFLEKDILLKLQLQEKGDNHTSR